jgi:hypothetical protein
VGGGGGVGWALKCEQAAGDVVFVPSGWAHAVLNLQVYYIRNLTGRFITLRFNLQIYYIRGKLGGKLFEGSTDRYSA